MTGRLHFKDGASSRRVAVKTFRKPLTDPEAEGLQRCMQDLASAGVCLPRLAVYKHPEAGWVQVSPLFGSLKRGSKLCQPQEFFKRIALSEKTFIMNQLTRVANAGYMPSFDLFLLFKDTALGVMPIDLDLIHPEPDACKRTSRLAQCLIRLGDSASEREILLETASNSGTSETLALLRQLFHTETGQYRRFWNLD
jgi:hypothetical protein